MDDYIDIDIDYTECDWGEVVYEEYDTGYEERECIIFGFQCMANGCPLKCKYKILK